MEKNTRKELLEKYKQLKTYMGVIQIKNKKNGKIYITAYPNLKNRWYAIQAQLDMGRHMNFELQKDWKELGAEAFTYEVLEEKVTEDITDIRWEMKQMKQLWLDKLSPYGEKGYNRQKED